MKISTIILTTLVVSVFISSCYFDVEQELYPTNKCDVENMSFANDIQPLIKLHCQNCHSSNFASAGVILDTYAGVRSVVDDSSFLNSINHTGDAVPMPLLPNAKAPQCAIDKCEEWVKDGAKDN